VSAGRKKVLRDGVQYSAATIFGQGVGLIRSVLIPVLLNPAQLGTWNLMNVVIGYAGNAHLGTLHGMNKLIPMLRGQGELADVEKIKDSIFWFNALLTSIAFVCVWCASYYISPEYRTALRITAVTVFLLGFFYYYYSILRSDNRFKLISAGVGGLSVLSTVFILGFAYFFPDRLVGALVGLAVAYGLVVLLWFLAGRYHYAFQVNGVVVRRCFIVGAPVMILGVFETVFISIDRWMIASFLSAEMLGYYALGIMANNLISLVPGSIASVLYPKMLERFGASGSEVALRGLMTGPSRAMAALISLLVGGAVLVLPFLIKVFVPKYLPSVSLFGILIPAAFFYASSVIPGNLLVALNRQKILIKIQIVSILLALILDAVVIKMGWGVVGIAWSTVVAYAVFGGGYMCSATYFVFDRRPDMLMFLIEIYGLFVAMVLGLVLAMMLIPAGETIGVALLFTVLRLMLFLAVLFPALWWSNRNGDLFAIAREIFPIIFNRLRGSSS